MRLLQLLSGLLTTSLVAQQPVSVTTVTETRHLVRGFSTSGEIRLPLAKMRLEIRHSDGKSVPVDLIVICDTSTGHYFWRHVELQGSGDLSSFLPLLAGPEAVYTSPEALYDFYIPGGLFITTHRGRINSLDEAVRSSLEDIKRNLSAHNVIENTRGSTPNVKAVGAIDPNWTCVSPPVSAICNSPEDKIVSVKRDGNNWQLVLRRRYDQELILDAKYNLISTRRMPAESKDE